MIQKLFFKAIETSLKNIDTKRDNRELILGRTIYPVKYDWINIFQKTVSQLIIFVVTFIEYVVMLTFYSVQELVILRPVDRKFAGHILYKN